MQLIQNFDFHKTMTTLRNQMKDDKAKDVDTTVYQFSQLPESGEKYRVTIKSVYSLVAGGTTFISHIISLPVLSDGTAPSAR